MTFEPDPTLTFDSFAVGPENRMAAGAARHAAESPGTRYNPLFVHGAPGTGKTHLLHAVGALARAVAPGLDVVLAAADPLAARIAAGGAEADAAAEELLGAGLVLLDDAQALAGKGRTQERLLRVWDELERRRVQIVVAADRAPGEIPDLDAELRRRFGGGLTVDVGEHGAETRRAVAARAADDAGLELDDAALDALAAGAGKGGHALRAAADRVVAEAGGAPDADAVRAVLGGGAQGGAPDEFGAFFSDIVSTVEELVEAAPWRRTLEEAAARWEGEGFRAGRLRAALEGDAAPDVGALVAGYERDAARLREIAEEVRGLDAERASSPVLADPDRLAEAEALLASAREEAESAGEGAAESAVADRWFLNREKLAWGWVGLEDRLLEELG